MILKNPSQKKYYYGPYEGYELRSQRRLREDLGVKETATEIILRLRSQVIELQSCIHQLETELTDQIENQKMRLSHNQEIYLEATWIEIEIQE